jgi:hypothetical protein
MPKASLAKAWCTDKMRETAALGRRVLAGVKPPGRRRRRIAGGGLCFLLALGLIH